MTTEAPSLRALDTRLEERAELLVEVARELPDLPSEEREARRVLVLDFLRNEVGEHMRVDRRLLYPRIAERLGDPLAPAPMNYDHRAIRWWIDEIDRADITDTSELQRLLYGVHALIRVHLSREEDLYIDAVGSAGWPSDF